MDDSSYEFERDCGAPMARRSRILAAVAVAALAGCCTYDPDALASDDVEDRREALACLGELAADDLTLRAEARAAALSRVRPDVEGDPAVRATAVRVLTAIEVDAAGAGGDAVQALSERVTAAGEQVHVRAEAVRALGRLGVLDRSVEALLRGRLTGDSSAVIRLAAAVALGGRGRISGETTDALIDALIDPDRDVRFAALRALRTIYGVDRGLARDRWREWREDELVLEEEPPPAATEPEPEGPALPEEPFPEEEFGQPPTEEQ